MKSPYIVEEHYGLRRMSYCTPLYASHLYIYTYSRAIIKYLKNTKRNSWCRKNNYVTHWEHAIWKSVYSHSEDWDFISKVDKNVFIFSKEIKYPLSTFFSLV